MKAMVIESNNLTFEIGDNVDLISNGETIYLSHDTGIWKFPVKESGISFETKHIVSFKMGIRGFSLFSKRNIRKKIKEGCQIELGWDNIATR